MTEWQHIQLYQSSQADAFRTVLEIAPELTDETKSWLEEKYQNAIKRRDEAQSQIDAEA